MKRLKKWGFSLGGREKVIDGLFLVVVIVVLSSKRGVRFGTLKCFDFFLGGGPLGSKSRLFFLLFFYFMYCCTIPFL